jgi:glyoxylase-like metal-dependent hydrolase (beta-lactamase superfamily II)
VTCAALLGSTLAVSGQAPGGTFEVVPIRDTVYMLVPPGDGANLTLQVGEDGALLVDTPAAALVPDLRALVEALAGVDVSYVVNTSVDPAHIGGNVPLARPEGFVGGGGFGGVPATALGGPVAVSILAHTNVLSAMVRNDAPAEAFPSVEYFLPEKDFSMNGEAIFAYHAPAAVTDGDTLVFFRSSDVLATGDVFTPDRYPMVDLAAGGSVQGLIDALNRVLALTVPRAFQEGGTKVVPGHGRLSEEADVVEYRDMVVIVRDRVRALVGDGASLADVQAARPSRDYDREYQSDSGPGPEEFVEIVYRSLANDGAAR